MQEISSATNEKLRELIALYRDKSLRDEKGVAVIDGLKLCADAAAHGLELLELWVDKDVYLQKQQSLLPIMDKAKNICILSSRAVERVSQLKAPQGVFAVVKRPETVSVKELTKFKRVLGLCELQNPENVGAAIRTAAALGYEGVLLSADCADVWSVRAIRAAAASQLFCSICVCDSFAAAVSELKCAGVYTLASALHRDSLTLGDVRIADRLFVAIGNEGRGLPDEVVDACDNSVYIPMSDNAESLNASAAAAILMWELRA